jgi:hypothetical protein
LLTIYILNTKPEDLKVEKRFDAHKPEKKRFETCKG